MNISEIAELAGVSRATISRYLNNGYVSLEKKERIQKVIEETGYMPSTFAQILRTNKSKLVGVIIPKISSESIGRIVDGISVSLSSCGYQVLLGNTDNQIEEELKFLKIFQNNKVDGIILIGTVLTKAHLELMKSMDIPIVVVGQEVKKFCCVYHDDFGAAKAITQTMIDRGRVHFAYIGVTTKDQAAGFMRIKGFMEALDEAGLTIEADRIREGEFSMDNGYQNMQAILQIDPLVDGVFCATDNIAIGALNYLKEAGRMPGQDLSLVGIGDTRLSNVVTPRLATVHYHYKTSGFEAAAMLLHMMDSGVHYVRELKLGYEVLKRESL